MAGALVGARERELIGEGAIKPRAPGCRPVEHAGVGDLGLTERELVAVAARPVLRPSTAGEGIGNPRPQNETGG
jgi:hypothetical protein